MNRLIALALVGTLAACGTTGPGDGDGSEWGDGLGDPANPVPGSAEDGPYTTRTMMDFTAEQLLPPNVEDVVQVLRAFGENPARGIIKAADKGGLSFLEELYSVLPGALKDRFEGWINGELNKVRINGKTLAEYSAQVAMLAEFALTKFALESELTLTISGSTHSLTAIDFHPVGIDARIPITGIASDILTQHPSVLVEQGGKLTLGDQTFGLRIGEYAWAGANAGVASLFGKDIQASLTGAINCQAVASAVAGKCVLGVCVGHETLIRNVCSGGLNLFVDQLHALFAILNLDAFHMALGNAILVDDTGDGIADRITNGVWDSEMNIGLGMRKAPSTFDASRPGSSPVTL